MTCQSIVDSWSTIVTLLFFFAHHPFITSPVIRPQDPLVFFFLTQSPFHFRKEFQAYLVRRPFRRHCYVIGSSSFPDLKLNC